MSESEKPFACPSPGCNMSFVNEDHLTVHRKRHDMNLNLCSNGKAGVFVADQTPTPTRFIRNCEEVGLFQDLQNVNPFEETFRRAVEAGKSGTLAVPEVGISDDTLHTPHIFPHIADLQSSNNNNNNNNNNILENGVSDTPVVISITDSSDDEAKNCSNDTTVSEESQKQNENSEGMKTIEEIDIESNNVDNVDTIVVQEADTSISTTIINLGNNYENNKNTSQLSINGKEVQLLIKTEDGKLMQLSVLPISQSLDNTKSVDIQSNTETVVIKTEPSLNYSENKRPAKSASSSRLSIAKMKLKQALRKNGVTTESQGEIEQGLIKSKKNDNIQNQSSNGTRKQDILERNRASSSRARAKRKAWIQQLERSVHNVNEANALLQLEVRALRSEVAKLKTILLAHKDCPVTKAMEQGNSIILGPKVISLSADMVQASQPVVGTNAAVKRASVISTEIVELPKKKSASILTSGNSSPMILPKSSVNISPLIHKGTILRNISGIKLLESENSVVTNNHDKGKQILIVQNKLRKSNDNVRQIIRINPNFEIENAASKSTGS